ncbi:immunoglobulin-like domain-containing protein [uncultured Algibacter sp.]|uniref:immunoglobulin-like domain-containing protein n=1 Tax=uncultured Algibacter sp. TaxID=298659 RepID=UPI00263381B3|nr:immunoglobulin-like domain-containing protein [uncultured Algibacter sp.]
MKIKNKLIKVVSLVWTIVLFVSCSEQSPITSDLTFFPTFEFEPTAIVAVGDTFTPSATANEGGVDLPVGISGSADTNTIGIYTITYSATNSDGFDGSETQTVIVHDPSIVGTDVSGDIQDVGRPERTGVISLVPGTTSIFFVTDFAFGGTFPMYFQMDGDVISEIAQVYPFGATSVDMTYDPITKTFTTFVNPYGFGYTFQYQ